MNKYIVRESSDKKFKGRVVSLPVDAEGVQYILNTEFSVVQRIGDGFILSNRDSVIELELQKQ